MSEEILLRTSERTTFMRCKQRWWWSYEEQLKPKETAPPLRFGSLIHEALAAYYIPGTKRGPHPTQSFIKAYDQDLKDKFKFGMKTEDEVWVDARDLGIAMLDHYVEQYGKDPRYKIIAPEQPFQIDIDDPDTGDYLCTYVGTFDAVIQDLKTQQIGLFEHKTAKTISYGHLPLDEQAGSYWAFAPDWMRYNKILKKGQDLDFILYNFLRKAPKDPRPTDAEGHCLNQNGSVSKVQPSPFFGRQLVYRSDADRRNLMLRVVAQAKEMIAIREGEVPVYKSPLMGCSGMFGCEFSDMCELHETGSDWESVRDAMFTTWEPYEIHEERVE